MNYRAFMIFLIMVGFFSCDDFLDIEPQQTVSTEEALSSGKGVKTALVGAYALRISQGGFDGNEIINSDLLIDDTNLTWTQFPDDLQDILNKNIDVDSKIPAGFWNYSYQLINQLNSIIGAIGNVDEEDRNGVEAEARFLRGMTYFDLVNLYAKTWIDGDPDINPGVPIVDHSNEGNSEDLNIPRNSVEQVYLFIIDDLRFAADHLKSENGVFATNHAARALLSRLYLMQENFDSASLEADLVINSNAFNLMSEPSLIFNVPENTSEDIFSLQFNAQDGLNGTTFIHAGGPGVNSGFIGVTDDHINKYEPGDKRALLFYPDPQNGIRRTAKWRPIPSNDGNMTLIRLAEMYLTRSECRYRNGEIEGATEDLNVIRRRAGLPELTAENVTLESILKERFLELVFEGQQFRDVKRTRQSVGNLPFNDPKLIFPIPQREMEVNSALVQNEGY